MGCWAVAMAVARVSLEVSAGGAQASNLKGPGVRRKTPGGCGLKSCLSPAWVLGKAVPRQAQSGLLSSARLRWDAPVTNRMSSWGRGRGAGRLGAGGGKEQKRWGAATGRSAGEEQGPAVGKLQQRSDPPHQWVSLQDKAPEGDRGCAGVGTPAPGSAGPAARHGPGRGSAGAARLPARLCPPVSLARVGDAGPRGGRVRPAGSSPRPRQGLGSVGFPRRGAGGCRCSGAWVPRAPAGQPGRAVRPGPFAA